MLQIITIITLVFHLCPPQNKPWLEYLSPLSSRPFPHTFFSSSNHLHLPPRLSRIGSARVRLKQVQSFCLAHFFCMSSSCGTIEGMLDAI
ncbi:hypothetical protein AKJ16_DCAP20876 [Drosera capensis]